jgi:DeoR/GlpR family transcriptional regulator of sugar metabolism
LCLAEALSQRHRLTVYTNDIHDAGRLVGRNDNRVFLFGGEVQGREGATLGPDTLAMLKNYYADFSFVGAGALTAHPWLMDYSREAAEMRGQMLLHARTAVVLADHTKFGRAATVRVPNFERAAYVITDRRPSSAFAKALAALEAEILVAEG